MDIINHQSEDINVMEQPDLPIFDVEQDIHTNSQSAGVKEEQNDDTLTEETFVLENEPNGLLYFYLHAVGKDLLQWEERLTIKTCLILTTRCPSPSEFQVLKFIIA